MIKEYEKSETPIIYGKRISREGESLFKKLTASIFYRLINLLSEVQFPVDTGDFRLIDKTVIDAYIIVFGKAFENIFIFWNDIDFYSDNFFIASILFIFIFACGFSERLGFDYNNNFIYGRRSINIVIRDKRIFV